MEKSALAAGTIAGIPLGIFLSPHIELPCNTISTVAFLHIFLRNAVIFTALVLAPRSIAIVALFLIGLFLGVVLGASVLKGYYMVLGYAVPETVAYLLAVRRSIAAGILILVAAGLYETYVLSTC